MSTKGAGNGSLNLLSYPYTSPRETLVVAHIQTTAGKRYLVESTVKKPELPGDRGETVNFQYDGIYVTSIQYIPQTHSGTYESYPMAVSHPTTGQVGGYITTRAGEVFYVPADVAQQIAGSRGAIVRFKPSTVGNIALDIRT